MNTHVTRKTVRDRTGNLRHLQIVRHAHPDPRRTDRPVREELLLDGAPVEPAGPGRFRVLSTGEILREVPSEP